MSGVPDGTQKVPAEGMLTPEALTLSASARSVEKTVPNSDIYAQASPTHLQLGGSVVRTNRDSTSTGRSADKSDIHTISETREILANFFRGSVSHWVRAGSVMATSTVHSRRTLFTSLADHVALPPPVRIPPAGDATVCPFGQRVDVTEASGHSAGLCLLIRSG